MCSLESADAGENIFTMNLKSDQQVDQYFKKSEELIEEDKEKDNTDDNLNAVNNDERKTLSKRLFGPLDAGSIRGSVFNLAILCLGSGCLALPKKVGKMSVVVALSDIILSGIAAYWTLNLLIIVSSKYKIYNYSELVRHKLGNGMARLLDITTLIYIFGIMILYQVIAYKLIGGVLNEFGNYGEKSIKDFYANTFWGHYICQFPVMIGVSIFLILPLCLLKNISKMRFNSLFGVFSLFFVVVIILIQTPNYFSAYLEKAAKDDKLHLNIWDISKGFQSDLYFFKGTATLFYAYSCHLGAFPIYKELKNNVNRRILKVFSRSILLAGVFYVIVGICGYLTDPVNTPELIIERYKLFNNDLVMTLGWIAFIFTLIMKIPANYNSFRITLLGLLNKKDEEMTDNL